MIYTKLPKSIYSLAVATFINGLGSFIFPFFTLFLTLKLGYSKSEAGMFTMLSMSMYVPGSIITSKIADTISRKKVMVITQLLCSLTFFICGFLMPHKEIIPYLILVGLFFDGATDPARQALQTDHTNFENRQESFSLLYLCYNIGFGFGPALAGLFFNNYTHWIFFGNGIAGFLAVILVIFTVPDKKPTKQMVEDSLKDNASDKAVIGNIFKALLERPLLLTYIAITSLFWIALSIVIFALPLYSSAIFGEVGPTYYGLFMSANAVTVVLCTPLAVIKTKNKNPLVAIAIAILLYSIGFFILANTMTFYLIGMGVIIFTLGEVLHATNNDYFVANHTPLTHRARFSSVLMILQGTGFAVGPLFGGILLDNLDFKMTFYITSILTFICFSLLVLLNKKFKKAEVK